MRKTAWVVAWVVAWAAAMAGAEARAQNCVECHRKESPGIVADWQASLHAKNDVSCDACHGSAHKSAADVANVLLPTPETCAQCHEERVRQYKSGKHAAAWAAMKAMPTAHYQPMQLMEGQKGCGGCHKIGTKTPEEMKQLRAQGLIYGVASCDSCHTRHSFSVAEARQPQACMTCHMGFDHPQWEMFSTSKHGERSALKQLGVLPATAAAPTCQACHMPDGSHGVKTAWGFLAVRLPLPEDKQWADDRTTILKALGVLDPAGNPTPRLEVVKAADVARLTREDWQRQRDQMIANCSKCHSTNFAKAELQKGDDLIRAGDRLMAEAIGIVAGLYRDGILKKHKDYANPYPDLLTFFDAPTGIEQTLFAMFLEHRMRLFQGAFHMNPDYSLWYGWNEMRRDLTEIRERAEELRRAAGKGAKAGAKPAKGAK